MNRKKPTFSRTFDDAAFATAIIGEIAQAEGWDSLDRCMEKDMNAFRSYQRHAEAAVRALRKLEWRDNNFKPSGIG